VDVKEWRLEKAQDEDCDTQNCAGCLHKFLFNLPSKAN
jgi:hypothetical protein